MLSRLLGISALWAQSLGFQKERVYCPRQTLPKNSSGGTIWTEKILSPPVCSGEPHGPLYHLIIVQELALVLEMLLVSWFSISSKKTSWTFKIIPAIMDLSLPLTEASRANTGYQRGTGIFTISTVWWVRGQVWNLRVWISEPPLVIWTWIGLINFKDFHFLTYKMRIICLPSRSAI